jgi:HK97 family phage major capsid protein
MDLKELTERIEGLESRAKEAIDSLASDETSAEDRKSLKESLEDLQGQIEPLREEREARLAAEERKSLVEGYEDLQKQFENLRKPTESPFGAPAPVETDTKAMEFYGDRNTPGKHSYWQDKFLAHEGDRSAKARIAEVEDELGQMQEEGKAMVQGTASAGGYLVPDQIAAEILELKVQYAILEPLFSKLQVNSDVLRISSITGGLTAGWVAELAEKPTQDPTFGEITASVFTVAGLAVASKQLIRNSRASLDRLINSDLAKRINTVKEVAYIDGSGTGQPRGINQTSGVNSVTLTGTTAVDLLDAITDAITDVETNFLESPNAIVMHPRTWAFLVKARESSSPTSYIVGPPGAAYPGRRPADSIPGYGSGQTPKGELFGHPVYTTANIPTDAGAGTDESIVIVGKFDEAIKLENAPIRFDQSEHVYFTSNQVVYRGEEDLGFTAGRYPKAFSVVSGVGLAGH